MAFKFRLETLLNHRRKLEESVVPELARAQQEVETEEAILSRLRSLAAWGEGELARNQSAGKAGWELAIFHDFLARVRSETKRSEERLGAAKSRVESLRAELLEKRKGRRLVEVLRDKSWQSYRRETQRLEQRELDEIAGIQVRRYQEGTNGSADGR